MILMSSLHPLNAHGSYTFYHFYYRYMPPSYQSIPSLQMEIVSYRNKLYREKNIYAHTHTHPEADRQTD